MAFDATHELDSLESEGARVRAWRVEQLIRLSVPEVDAERIAKAPVDLGYVRDLLGRGCPPDRVAAIVT